MAEPERRVVPVASGREFLWGLLVLFTIAGFLVWLTR